MPSMPDSLLPHGVRFAFGTLTVIPVRVSRWDRDAARGGMLCAPLVGLVVGGCAAAVGGGLLALGTGAMVASVAAVAVPAVLTRGLHLDGLADTADGLGSGKPADDALRIMKQSDIGPFGVLTLVFVLLGQVAAVARLYEESWVRGGFAVVLSAVVARLALTFAARAGVPAARPEGLGAAVAGVVPVRWVWGVGGAVGVLAAAVGWWAGVFTALPAAVLGVGAAELLLRRCRERFGGVTGDVFGGVAEVAGVVSLVVMTVG
ncbi:adenosylcobinamide-GDP ribazoletransferase [Streptomyces sp. 4F14]|uniref:adenosylcobinamide-GDP ribazoletransferase n=1 Tax=Streptomyces sp. 4F14 TaxID=3394380 RepID=UPI003A8C0CEA